MLARTAVQPRVLVALIQCATMATEVVQVATESEEDVRFRYSGKIRCGLRFFGVFLRSFTVFGPPLRPPPRMSPYRECAKRENDERDMDS